MRHLKSYLNYLSLLILSLSITFQATLLHAEPKEHIVEGTVVEVVPSKKEIYVLSEGEKHEYYFLPNTQLLKADKVVRFSELQTGQRVKVVAKKIGKRLDPQLVTIFE